MAAGLLALLDDIAALSRLAAASLDDIAGAAAKAGTKAAGVVIDDTAVTPNYVTGLSPARELPIVRKIAVGSLKNKLLILLPAALALSRFAPWAITPLLMAGGLYLCFEGAEKLLGHGQAHATEASTPADPAEIEKQRVDGAIKTDFILSAEIMAIALAEIDQPDLVTRGLVLAAVGLFITVAVYGVVALIVKADDAGVSLARGHRPGPVRTLGRGLVSGMPILLRALATVGTAAMLWVGGGILIHGAAELGWHAPEHLRAAIADTAARAVPALHGIVHWLAEALVSGVVGVAAGFAVLAALRLVRRPA